MRVADPPSFVGCIPILLGSIALTIGLRCPCAIAGSETARQASRPTTNLSLEVTQILFDMLSPLTTPCPRNHSTSAECHQDTLYRELPSPFESEQPGVKIAIAALLLDITFRPNTPHLALTFFPGLAQHQSRNRSLPPSLTPPTPAAKFLISPHKGELPENSRYPRCVDAHLCVCSAGRMRRQQKKGHCSGGDPACANGNQGRPDRAIQSRSVRRRNLKRFRAPVSHGRLRSQRRHRAIP